MSTTIVDTHCGKCHHIEAHDKITCDTCGSCLSNDSGFIVREIGNSFPLILICGGTNYDFCNYKCLLDFAIKELTKEK
jgi:hypothetical protein